MPGAELLPRQDGMPRGRAMCMQDAVQGREDFERLNSIMNRLIEDNTKPGWLEDNPHSIAAHILKVHDQHGKPLSRARLIQVPLLDLTLTSILPRNAYAQVSSCLTRVPYSTQICGACDCISIA